ncbi:MAG: hypothetical protein H8D63_03205, partial [Parcubacteria group bacterium]|nr:hypothetical protein [Parcubacteria group bacterium]
MSASRIHLIFILFCILALILLARLFHVQIISGATYTEKAQKQYVQTVPDNFNRGTIYFQYEDTNKKPFQAATLNYGYRIIMDPSKVEEPEALCAALVELIPDSSHEDCIHSAQKSGAGDQHELLAEKMPENVAEAIEALPYTGIGAYRHAWRFYPGGTLGAHVLGFVGYQGDALGGRYGLERSYDHTLRRTDEHVEVNFFAELFANITESVFESGYNREGDVVTFIEPTVQGFVEDVLTDMQDTWQSESGGVIVIDPNTGAVRAMAAFPSFDPNTYAEEESVSVFVNPLVERVYEMGSIVKPLTVAAGLSEGVITAESTYTDTGLVTLNGYTIGNYDGKARGVVDMQEVLN